MAPSQDGMIHASGSNTAIAAKTAMDESNDKLFGKLPPDLKRKFVHVQDGAGKPRVRVNLDTVNIQEIPDSVRKITAVYPRSWFPTEMQSPAPSAHGTEFFPDDEDDLDDSRADGGPSARGRTFVQLPLPDGTETSLPVPRMRKSHRVRESTINELGYRLSWQQSRIFDRKMVFLQKSLDAYRKLMCDLTVKAKADGKSQYDISDSPHFELRRGKRRLLERMARREARADSEGH